VTCAHCGTECAPRPGKKFCSKRCRDAARWSTNRGPRARGNGRRNGAVVQESERVRLIRYDRPRRGQRPVMVEPTPGAMAYFFLERIQD
jgi:hypothetical protein